MVNQSIMDRGEFTQEDLKKLAAQCIGHVRVPDRFRIITDTSNFFSVDFNDILVLDGNPYLIRNYEREGRFGIEDQPKYWVKRAIELTTGKLKVIKMVFPEKFTARIGDLTFDCVRSPKKEARILELVRGHRNFMQGMSTKDSAGNIIRIIDYIRGSTMADYVLTLGNDHYEYFFEFFPPLLNDYIDLVKAIQFLHNSGEKHGDIRRDHIIRSKHDSSYYWIDFDFNYWHQENMFTYDMFGLGNILIYLVGRGDVTSQHLRTSSTSVFDQLITGDLNIVFNNRVANLQKVYPYIPDVLNNILLHFSFSADTFYDDTGQFLSDLEEAKTYINTFTK
jgi:hypothetical protein